MFPALIINPLATTFISLSTMLGVFVHDTKIDQFTTVAISITSVSTASYEGFQVKVKQTDPHTHSERISLTEAVRNLQSGNPRIHPRVADQKKYKLQRNVAKGHHPFDNYSLPITG